KPHLGDVDGARDRQQRKNDGREGEQQTDYEGEMPSAQRRRPLIRGLHHAQLPGRPRGAGGERWPGCMSVEVRLDEQVVRLNEPLLVSRAALAAEQMGVEPR